MPVSKQKAIRFKILQGLYKFYEEKGLGNYMDITYEFLDEINITLDEYKVAMQYLRECTLVSTSIDFGIAMITTYGIDVYEMTIESPDTDTQFFPAHIYNIINSNISDSQVAQGEHIVQQSIQISNEVESKAIELLTAFKNQFESIKDKLEKLPQELISDDIKTLVAEIPKKDKKSLFERAKTLYNNVRLIALVSNDVQTILVPIALQLYELFK